MSRSFPWLQMTDMRRYSHSVINAAALEVHSRYAYDGAGKISSITHAKSEIAAGQAWNGTATLPASITPSQTIAAYHLSYDRDNRLTAFASYTDRFRTAYSYDATDQLTAATSSTIVGLAAPSPLPATESYNVDLNGNRRTSGGVSQSASGTHNRLQTDGTFNYTYDNEGNTLAKTRIATGAVTQFSWDHRNRLTAVRERAGANAVVSKETIYAYDVFDRKTLDRFDSDGLSGSNRDDLWVIDGQHPLLQYRDSDGVGPAQPYRLANRYLHGAVIDQILADEQYASGTGPVLSGTVASPTPGTTLWAVADHLGSVRDLVDNNGITRQHVVYDSFGNRLSEVDRNAAGTVIASTNAAAVDTIFGYTGREWDKDTSLQYNRARWYDPATGRWLGEDPLGLEPDVNMYRYTKNGPTTKTDPSGLVETFPLAGPDGKPYDGPVPHPWQPGYGAHAQYVKGALAKYEYPKLLDPKPGPVVLSHRNGMPYRLWGTWKVSVCAYGGFTQAGHAWIRYENTVSGEVHTAGAYPVGSGGWTGQAVIVPGAQFDYAGDIKSSEGEWGRFSSRSVFVRNPKLFFRPGFSNRTENCSTYARDVWYQYTGEWFWFNFPPGVDNPWELAGDIDQANKVGPPVVPRFPPNNWEE